MIKKVGLIIFLPFFFITTNAFGQLTDWHLGAGLMNQSPGRYQTEVAGDKSKMNNQPTLQTGLVYNFDEDWTFHGDFGFLWPGDTEESYISKQVYFFNAHGGYALSKKWLIRLGTSFYFTRISGDGGTTSIRNGNGFTDFYVPEQSIISQNTTLNIAKEYFFHKEYSVKGEVYVFNPISSEKRTINLALTLHYHLGDSLWKD